MGCWTTELVRLNDGRLIQATIPAEMDMAVLSELTERMASLTLPDVDISASWREVLLLPAACGPKLFSRLINYSVGSPEQARSDLEALVNSCSRSFGQAISLRISKSAVVDIRKVGSFFEMNAYRTKAVTLRKNLVYVDQVNGVTSYVPPPASKVDALVRDLYNVISKIPDDDMALLALAFYATCHFIAIHPLNDGNGRMGRALFMRLCGKREGTSKISLIIISLLSLKYEQIFYAALMKYCLTGSADMLSHVLLISLNEISSGKFTSEFKQHTATYDSRLSDISLEQITAKRRQDVRKMMQIMI